MRKSLRRNDGFNLKNPKSASQSFSKPNSHAEARLLEAKSGFLGCL